MTKRYKTWTGILAMVPLIMFIGYIISFAIFMMNMFRQHEQFTDSPDMTAFIGIFIVCIIMIIAGLAALIFFLVHAVNNKRLDETERIIWILIFIFAGMIAFPIYWFMKIYKQPSAVQGSQDLSSQTFTR